MVSNAAKQSAEICMYRTAHTHSQRSHLDYAIPCGYLFVFFLNESKCKKGTDTPACTAKTKDKNNKNRRNEVRRVSECVPAHDCSRDNKLECRIRKQRSKNKIALVVLVAGALMVSQSRSCAATELLTTEPAVYAHMTEHSAEIWSAHKDMRFFSSSSCFCLLWLLLPQLV